MRAHSGIARPAGSAEVKDAEMVEDGSPPLSAALKFCASPVLARRFSMPDGPTVIRLPGIRISVLFPVFRARTVTPCPEVSVRKMRVMSPCALTVAIVPRMPTLAWGVFMMNAAGVRLLTSPVTVRAVPGTRFRMRLCSVSLSVKSANETSVPGEILMVEVSGNMSCALPEALLWSTAETGTSILRARSVVVPFAEERTLGVTERTSAPSSAAFSVGGHPCGVERQYNQPNDS